MEDDLKDTSKQIKSVVRRVIFTTLSVLCMVIIFMFSSKDADESKEDSYEVGLLVGSIIYSDFDEWTEEDRLSFAEKIDYPVRKTAHATEYAILGMLLFGALYEEIRGKKKAGVFAWIITTLYAGTDEIHQFFVPGRACKFTDVMIDSGGAVFGILAVVCLVSVLIKLREKHKSKICK